MNPWGGLLIGLGLVMFIIGFKGTQHDVIDTVKGKVSAPQTTSTGGSTGGNQPGSGKTPPVQEV